MRTFLQIVFDSIFPPTTHERLLRDITPTLFLTHYQPIKINQTITLSPYTNQTVKAAVAACKFEKNQHAAKLLTHLVTQYLTTNPTSGHTMLIPIPLSRERTKERGFNQVRRVLEYLPSSTDITLLDGLFRTRDTVRQTSLNRHARLTNLTGVFSPTTALRTVDWTNVSRVIICDDVLTTGATVSAARLVVQPHIPHHVQCMTLAWAH